MVDLEKQPADFIQTIRRQSPEIDGLLYLAESPAEWDWANPQKNPFQVIKIGRAIEQKLGPDSQALATAQEVFKIQMIDPFGFLEAGALSSVEIDSRIDEIITNDEVLYGISIKREHLFTSGEPPFPDEVKINSMCRLAAGILLFTGSEIARIFPKEEVSTVIDALALPLAKVLNAAFLVRPPGNYPEVIEGIKVVIELGIPAEPSQS